MKVILIYFFPEILYFKDIKSSQVVTISAEEVQDPPTHKNERKHINLAVIYYLHVSRSLLAAYTQLLSNICTENL